MYYSLVQLDKVYDNYNDANKASNEQNMKSSYPVAFVSEEAAEAFRTGQWSQYMEEHLMPYYSMKDAVCYVDGSCNFGDKGDTEQAEQYATYGIIIFFRTGEVFIETGKMVDAADGSPVYYVDRKDENGNMRIENDPVSYEVIESEAGVVTKSRNVAGEIEAARRAMDICFQQKGLKDIELHYDCDQVRKGYEGFISGDGNTNISYCYRKFCQQIVDKFGKNAVSPTHVKSHEKAVPVEGDAFIHSVYNDLVDSFAKAETVTRRIDRSEILSVKYALLQSNMNINCAGSIDEKRKIATELFCEIQKNELLVPKFK